MTFLKDTKVTKSHFSIEPFIMLSRIGGTIGVGQALVWIINFSIDIVFNVFIFIYNIYLRLNIVKAH